MLGGPVKPRPEPFATVRDPHGDLDGRQERPHDVRLLPVVRHAEEVVVEPLAMGGLPSFLLPSLSLLLGPLAPFPGLLLGKPREPPS